jgi:hypothetical protein
LPATGTSRATPTKTEPLPVPLRSPAGESGLGLFLSRRNRHRFRSEEIFSAPIRTSLVETQRGIGHRRHRRHKKKMVLAEAQRPAKTNVGGVLRTPIWSAPPCLPLCPSCLRGETLKSSEQKAAKEAKGERAGFLLASSSPDGTVTGSAPETLSAPIRTSLAESQSPQRASGQESPTLVGRDLRARLLAQGGGREKSP